MRMKGALSLLVALLLTGVMTLGVHAESHGEEEEDGSSDNHTHQGRGAGAREHDHDGNDTDEVDEDDGDGQGLNRSRDRDHPRNHSVQGRALGLDGEWHECRRAAGDNETEKRDCHDEAMQRAVERHDAIKAARANGSVGGELNISRGQAHIDAEGGLNLSVQEARRAGDPDLRVVVGADLDRGKTLVLFIDPEMFDGDGNLVLRYFDIAEDGSETENVSFAQADSLQDALDPDDDLVAEYWIIEDHQGIHAMVSIPDWSVHAVTMETSSASTPIPTTALGLLIVTFVVMASALWWQRPGRRE